MREVKDILLSNRQDKSVNSGNNCASCGKSSEHEQGREMIYKKVRILVKILRNWAL